MIFEWIKVILRILARPVTAISVAFVAFIFLIKLENDVEAALFASCGIFLIAALVHLLSKRTSFSIYFSLCIALAVAASSMVKARMTGMSMHSFDLALIVDFPMLAFFLSGYSAYAVPVLVMVACMIGFMTVIYIWEGQTKVPAMHAVLLLVTPIVLYPFARPAWASDQSYLFHGRHLSALLASFEDLPLIWAEHPVAERIAGTADIEPYTQPFICNEDARQPDIIVVHAESQLPPEWMSMRPVGGVLESFRAEDGKLHALGVETYGGGSWITVSSVMTGMSGADFSWMRHFIAKSLVGNVRASVPEILSKCGYQTTALLGMGYDQFALGPLLSSMGVSDVDDPEEMGIASISERDSRYFDTAIARIKENRKLSQQPQFLYIETMFAHSPYDDTLAADTLLDGQPFSANWPDPMRWSGFSLNA